MSSDTYVVFTKSSNHWWTRFLDPFISHCYVLEQSKGKWIVYGKSHKQVELYTIDGYSDILSTSIIIKAEKANKPRGLFMLNTCVGNVKQYLGIRNPFILTPKQLYRHLSWCKKQRNQRRQPKK